MGKAIEVINAQGFYAPVQCVFLMDRGQSIHLVIEFKRDTHVVRCQQRPPLIGPVDPCGGSPSVTKECLGAVQIFFVKCLEPKNLNRAGLLRFLEDKAMMAPFLHRAEIHMFICFI